MIVVKLGGSILREEIHDFYADLRDHVMRRKVILVHGGSDTVDEVAERMGVEQKFIVSPSGFRSRHTDKSMIGIYQMAVAGRVNKDLVARLQRFGINAIGLSGMDGSLVKARRKKKIKSVEGDGIRTIVDDYSGRITRVDSRLLKSLLSLNYLPVLAPLAISENFEPLNVDGDRLAASVAGAVGAERLVIFTDVPGVLLKGELVSQMRTGEVKEMIRAVEAGMKKKLYAASEALNLGVKEVIIRSVFGERPLTSALRHEECTVIRG
ncbi:MAG: [LysW]-aminoadipate kinase [Candidatus Geothermarchaeales archaeon]